MSMDEIREEIDALDDEIIRLLGRRFEYVQAAAKFKANASAICALDRLATMIQQRRIWAQNAGLDADVIKKMYRDLAAYFIAEEMQRFEILQTNSTNS